MAPHDADEAPAAEVVAEETPSHKKSKNPDFDRQLALAKQVSVALVFREREQNWEVGNSSEYLTGTRWRRAP